MHVDLRKIMSENQTLITRPVNGWARSVESDLIRKQHRDELDGERRHLSLVNGVADKLHMLLDFANEGVVVCRSNITGDRDVQTNRNAVLVLD